MFQTGLAAMQSAQSRLNHTNLQMATGRRILTPSDDPSGAALTVQLDSAVKATEQYQRNADYAQPRLEQEESQLDAIQTAVQRVRELVVAGSNDTYNQSNRAIIASEIRQIRDDIFDIANTQDANGEYLFAGTRSQTSPFVMADDGRVSYVGAEGAGAVRELAISSTRRVAVGDTGARVLMEIPERSGLFTEAVPASTNTGTVNAAKVEAGNLDDALNSAGQTLRIRFSYPAANPGSVAYQILDTKGNSVRDANGDLLSGFYGTTTLLGAFVPPVPNEPIEFAGRRVTLIGIPEHENLTVTPPHYAEIISRPVPHSQVSLFQTLNSIVTALEAPQSDEAEQEIFSKASSMALRNIDSGMDRLNEVRTSVGLRLSTLDIQTNLNDERLLNLEETLSEVRDLDYADAISRFKLQEVVLQAAQQTYTQVNKLSLFDFL
jgi:flagellar hook-associated protein 3 FlgL